MGIKFSFDNDGDLNYKSNESKWRIYVFFEENNEGDFWNLKLKTYVGSKKSRYDEMLDYVFSPTQ